MSRHHPLPPDLINLESQLRGLSLPAGKLGRDATLYQCGWAAAEAQFRASQSQHRWIWKSSSGVLAASVMLLSVLLVKQDAAHEAHSPPSGDGSYARQSVVVELAPAAGPVAEARPFPFVNFAMRFAPDDRSLLAVRDRALRGHLPEISHSADQGDVLHRRPKTSRELLDELLERNLQS
jgi:hypothetical protein